MLGSTSAACLDSTWTDALSFAHRHASHCRSQSAPRQPKKKEPPRAQRGALRHECVMCKTQVFLSACVQEAWGLQTAYWDAAIQTSPPEAKRAAETFLWTWTRVSPKHAGGLGKARSPTEAETELAGVWKGGGGWLVRGAPVELCCCSDPTSPHACSLVGA